MSSVRRRAAALLTGLVAGALVLSGCSIYDAPLPGGPDAGSKPMRLKVMFRDVLDLVPQSTVKVNDVSVGKVKSVELKGYVAQVDIEVPRDLDLPDNATAQIRQTSLLGEKFVSLAPPQDPSEGKLSDGDVIGLDRTGRNPEVEEVFGALALLLNGGGVGQLKTIAEELNAAFDGREQDIRSVLDQIRLFMGQLDRNKQSIVTALENTSRLAAEARKQDGAIRSALDDIPGALRSVNRQRADLVKMLQALDRLSGVGVRVIQASKESTISSLRDLAPVLDAFAKAGQNFPKSFQVFLTYPFVDEAVGRDPQVARNLHMGDYTNLSVNLDLNISDLKLPAGPTGTIPPQICEALQKAIDQVDNMPGLTPEQKRQVKEALRAGITGDKCELSGDALQAMIAAVIYRVLGPAVSDAICPGAGPKICDALQNPTALPTLTLGPNPLGLPRADLNDSYRVPQPIDPFGLAAHGLDPGIGTMLLQGVAEVR